MVIDNSTMSTDGPVTTSTDCIEEYSTTYQVGFVAQAPSFRVVPGALLRTDKVRPLTLGTKFFPKDWAERRTSPHRCPPQVYKHVPLHLHTWRQSLSQ